MVHNIYKVVSTPSAYYYLCSQVWHWTTKVYERRALTFLPLLGIQLCSSLPVFETLEIRRGAWQFRPWFLTAWKASQLYSLIKDYSPGKFHFLHLLSPITQKRENKNVQNKIQVTMTRSANTESTSNFSARYRLAQKTLDIRYLTFKNRASYI